MRVSAIIPATDAPPTLRACLAAIRSADLGPEELIVVEEPGGTGPAAARNLGAAAATGDVLVFVDADVLVHHDAFARIRAALTADSTLAGVFGAYDDRPPEGGTVSAFRNLLHHHVHTSSAGVASTFWTGLGAVRRDTFLAHGGFDEQRYPRASIEDVELGMRMVARGERLTLDPAIQGTHLKSWTLPDVVRTDFARRGVPWVTLLCEQGSLPAALNLGWRYRLSALSTVAAVAAGAARRPALALAALMALVYLNRDFYRLLSRRRGPFEAALGVGLHGLHHLTSSAAAVVGVFAYFATSRRRRREVVDHART